MSDDFEWLEGPEPPPPPPPEERRPARWSGRPPEDVPAEASSAGDEPPRRWLRRIVAGVVFLFAVAGLVAGAAVLLPGDEEAEAPTGAQEQTDAPEEDGPEEDGPQDDSELEEGEFGAFAHVLDTVDASEREMIEFQIAAFQAEPDPETDEPRSEEAIRDDIADAAGSSVEDLREIRDELTAELPDGAAADAAAAVRDAYVEHLDAWIAHLDEVVEDPDLARPDAPEGTYEDINTTAEDFAEQLRASLPDDAPEDIRDLAALILERGFTRDEPGSGDMV